MATNNTIVLKGDLERWHDEGRCDTTPIKPGMLIARTSTGKLVPHADDGGDAMPYFAKEDSLRGGTKEGTLQNDAEYYVDGDLVLFHKAQNGDVINALLADGEVIAVGSPIASNGDGLVRLGVVGTDSILGFADEALSPVGDNGFVAVAIK